MNRKIKRYAVEPSVFKDYALEGYEHDVVDYLLKPIEFDRFFKAVIKSMDRINVISGNPTEIIHTIVEEVQKENFFFVKNFTQKPIYAHTQLIHRQSRQNTDRRWQSYHH